MIPYPGTSIKFRKGLNDLSAPALSKQSEQPISRKKSESRLAAPDSSLRTSETFPPAQGFTNLKVYHPFRQFMLEKCDGIYFIQYQDKEALDRHSSGVQP